MFLVNRIGGVKITVLASCVVDRVFESWSGYTKHGMCCLSTKHAALRRKTK
jgi:hypothetical protein